MIRTRKKRCTFSWVLNILVLILFFCFAENKLKIEQEFSLLELSSNKSEENLSRKSFGVIDDTNVDVSGVTDATEKTQGDPKGTLGYGNQEIGSSIHSVDELISPIVSMCLAELRNIYDFLESEYNSISSVPMLEYLEDCRKTRRTMDEILKVMIRAKELLFYEEKNNPLDSTLKTKRKRGSNTESEKKSRASDLFFYLQTNISILKKTISLYNIKYKVFLSQEQILGRIKKLRNEINLLILTFKKTDKKRSFEKVISEITKSVSKVIDEYRSILQKTHLFMSTKDHSRYSKNVDHYLQSVSCILKYRLQYSPLFEELLFILKPRLQFCR
ncbi:signal peptide, secreted protein [Cryptosporidium felis]|nr:signal peptide, secreted protein [Cryptosporidium felis]